MESYCLKCKAKTGSRDMKMMKDKRGKEYTSSKCDRCGGNKALYGKGLMYRGKGLMFR